MNNLNQLKKTTFCPICNCSKFKNLGRIKNISENLDNNFSLLNYLYDESYIVPKELDNVFDLIQCLLCQHCCLSLIPDQKFLDDLYRNGSSYLAHDTEQELIKKKQFIEKKLDGANPDFNHWIFKYLKNSKPGKYFEVGPGTCTLFKTFKLKDWICEGYELKSWITDKDIFNFFDKIPKDKKDVIVMQDVLEHVANPKEFLTSFSFFLKKTGFLFLTFPNASSYRAKIFKTKWRMITPLNHINFFSKKSITRLLGDCGYKLISAKAVSMVDLRKLTKSIFKLPIIIILDLIKLDFHKAIRQISEIIINIIDLFSGDQMHVIAIKKND